MIHDTHSAQISQKQDGCNIYAIMKAMWVPGYHHNGFVATHVPGHMMDGYILLLPMNQGVLNKQSKELNISGHKYINQSINQSEFIHDKRNKSNQF